jgi:membrane fusion protein, heavy metal efflux system
MLTAIRCAVLAAAVTIGMGTATAHEGEDHSHDQPPTRASDVSAAPRLQAASEHFELVAIARDGALRIFLDRFKTNEPVTTADVTVETPEGSKPASAAGDGSYTLAARWSTQPGHYDLIFTIVAGSDADVLSGSLDIGPPTTGAVPGATTSARWPISAPLSIAVLAALAGIIVGAGATAFLGRRRVGRTATTIVALTFALTTVALAHEGEDHGAPPKAAAAGVRDIAQRAADGSLFVPKPMQRLLGIRTEVVAAATHRRTIELPARIIPDPNASGLVQASAGGRLSPPRGGFPRLGSRVNAGDILAYVTAPLQSIDRSDMRQRQGELDPQISIVERRIVRFETLVEKGASTQVQLDEARLELQGLKDRRAALDQARGEPEALTAPVAGVIAQVNAVAGQMAQPNTILFQVVEPGRLWVEALSFEVLRTTQQAAAKIGPGRILSLSYAGAGLADRNQAIPIHFKVEDDTSGLRIGQFLTVLAATDEERDGMALPRSAIVRTQSGQDVIFEHTSAERFEPRFVRVEPLDGERVLVSAGATSGARIVTQGAELLEQIR